jgi:hypothetical protein
VETILPAAIEQCLDKGAKRLGNALKMLDWPNGGKDAPCHEINAVINISCFLSQMEPPFDLYAEGTIAQRGRVDLIGCNGETAFALEAKGFGRINAKSTEVVADLKRLLHGFSPSLSELAGNVEAKDWWNHAQSRWAIIVISSFRGAAVKEAWLADDEEVVRAKLATYSAAEHAAELDGVPSGFLELHRALRNAQRGASFITDGKQWDAGEGWLLWAAIPLEKLA